MPKTSGFETPGSQIVRDRPVEAVYITATAREIGDDALDEVIPRGVQGDGGRSALRADELRGACDLRPLVTHLESCDVHVSGRDLVNGRGLDSRHAVDPSSG